MINKPMPKNDLNKNLDLKRYDSSGGITASKLNLGLWIVSHRRQFVLGVIGVLIAASAVFYGYSIYNYIDYLFFGGKQERLAIEQMATTSPIDEQQRLKNLAKKLEGSAPQVFLNNEKYDFIAQVKNPNNNFFARFTYCFADNSQELACGSAFIMPDETRYVLSWANDLKFKPAQVSVVLKDITWQRLDYHKYPDWKTFSASRLNFAVENASFTAAAASGLSEKINLDVLQFDIVNKTAYNYWEVPLNIVLLSGNAPIAINHHVLNEFKSGETRSVRLSWPDSISQPSQITVLPDINITDDNVYMKYQ
jgi:hypothetical protein